MSIDERLIHDCAFMSMCASLPADVFAQQLVQVLAAIPTVQYSFISIALYHSTCSLLYACECVFAVSLTVSA